MNIEGGPAAFLGALGLAALAGGLAYGAHMVAPAGDSRGDSSTIAMSDDFCTLMNEMVAFTNALEAQDPGPALMMDESTGDDPETVTSMHQFGQVMLDAIGPVGGFQSHAAELVTDPDVATAFETLATVTPALMEYVGRAALDAESVADYVAAMFGSLGDPELLALMQDGDAADLVVQEYVLATCGFDILGGDSDSGNEVDGDIDTDTDPGEEAVKADVSMLGDLMVSYYSDWEEGDPQPEFVPSGTGYEFDGGFLGWSDEGVVLTDQYANGPDDWCVEVTSADDPERPWTYSAQSGLAQGTCS